MLSKINLLDSLDSEFSLLVIMLDGLLFRLERQEESPDNEMVRKQADRVKNLL